jgi:hypothetical protein
LVYPNWQHQAKKPPAALPFPELSLPYPCSRVIGFIKELPKSASKQALIRRRSRESLHRRKR